MNQARLGIKERIVEAAVHLFAHRGFSGTSTREIARLADVNEASLFRHFASKQDLFWAALQSRLRHLRIRKELQDGLSNQADPELVFPLIIELVLEISTYQSELIRLLDIGLLELRPGAERIYREQVAPIFQAISDYLDKSIKRGLLRGLDPAITTVALTTTVLAHQGLYQLFTGSGVPYANSGEAVRAYSKFWLNALRTENKMESSSVAKSTTN
jgi:Transcriptional regulator